MEIGEVLEGSWEALGLGGSFEELWDAFGEALGRLWRGDGSLGGTRQGGFGIVWKPLGDCGEALGCFGEAWVRLR